METLFNEEIRGTMESVIIARIQIENNLVDFVFRGFFLHGIKDFAFDLIFLDPG